MTTPTIVIRDVKKLLVVVAMMATVSQNRIENFAVCQFCTIFAANKLKL